MKNSDEHSQFKRGVTICTFAVVICIALGCLSAGLGWLPFRIAFLLSQVVVISLVIWQACDPFADAAQWIGIHFRLPGSVRGATLDAVASSMPELFTGIFFVVLAIMSTGESGTITESGGEGFGASIATCAGSAVYNMILIPAICTLVISFSRKDRPTIDVERRVLSRDGVWFMYCEIVLIAFLFSPMLHWWMAAVLIGLYVVYCLILYQDTQIHRQKTAGNRSSSKTDCTEQTELPDEAGVLFGKFQVPLNLTSAWVVIAGSTAVAAFACYWLVNVTHSAAEQLEIPIFFVAVVLAAAASSVPDTFLSVAAAKRGDDDGAVSNAFGSNIFDICICLTVPLLIASWMNGWQPISLTQNGVPMPGIMELRILLCVLSTATLGIMWHKQQLTRTKAFVLCGLYGLFVSFAVAGSLGFDLRHLLT